MTKNTRLKGKRFRSVIADCNALWEVKRSRGRGVFECEVVNEPIEIDGKTYDGDFAGRRGVFTREDIEAKLRWQAFSDERWAEHEGFYEGLGDHQVVHYHHGGGEFIRCHAVVAGPRHELDHPCVKEGEKALKIVALVGKWRDYDLRPDGYHVQRIGRLFKPNASCIYENPKAPAQTRREDPRHMKPVAIPEVA
jgi:hypothetical protein